MAAVSVGLLVLSAGVVAAAIERLLHMIPGLF
jgi:hypothetical protein